MNTHDIDIDIDIELPPLPEWADTTLQGEDRDSLFTWAEAAIEAYCKRRGEPVAWPTHEFAIVVDRMYEGEGPSLAMWNGENYQFSDGDCYDRETDGSLDGYTAEWLTHHQLEQRLFAPQPAEPVEGTPIQERIAKLEQDSKKKAALDRSRERLEAGKIRAEIEPLRFEQPAEPVKDDISLDRLADYIADNWPDKKYSLEEIAQRLHATRPGAFMPAA